MPSSEENDRRSKEHADILVETVDVISREFDKCGAALSDLRDALSVMRETSHELRSALDDASGDEQSARADIISDARRALRDAGLYPEHISYEFTNKLVSLTNLIFEHSDALDDARRRVNYN